VTHGACRQRCNGGLTARAADVGQQPFLAARKAQPDGFPGIAVAAAVQVGEGRRRYSVLAEPDLLSLYRGEIILQVKACAQPRSMWKKKLLPLVACLGIRSSGL